MFTRRSMSLFRTRTHLCFPHRHHVMSNAASLPISRMKERPVQLMGSTFQQVARFSNGFFGASGGRGGQNQQHEWFRKISNADAEFQSDPSTYEAACFHPDDDARQRDIRTELSLSLPCDELLAIFDRISERIQYMPLEAKILSEMREIVRDIREICLERMNTDAPFSHKTLQRLEYIILFVSIFYHNGDLSHWCLTSKDAESLWKLFRTLEHVSHIQRANYSLRMLRKSIPMEADRGITSATHYRIRSGLRSVHGFAFHLTCAVNENQLRQQQWFTDEDEILLLRLAGSLKRYAEANDTTLKDRMWISVDPSIWEGQNGSHHMLKKMISEKQLERKTILG
ncbi:unnamed protein product [Periconia digitata]|uniref:Uncharacterized protein n=1 Tax=Periconia digitata TaxID=1303443 RepID=A0A9W4UNJ7_9PLEO|nr:unnamed protein product [Periconia digitata]